MSGTAFAGDKILITTLLAIDLNDGPEIRICDGGEVVWNGDVYSSEDPVFGAVAGIELPEEQIADQAISGTIVFFPKSEAAAATLSASKYKRSPIKVWTARVDEQTGQIVGTPEQEADLLLDSTQLEPGLRTRTLRMEFMSAGERLFAINRGNVLSPAFHRTVWPGEAGLDHATGISLTIAWGVAAPPRGVSSVVGVASGGSGGLLENQNMVAV